MLPGSHLNRGVLGFDHIVDHIQFGAYGNSGDESFTEQLSGIKGAKKEWKCQKKVPIALWAQDAANSSLATWGEGFSPLEEKCCNLWGIMLSYRKFYM